MLRILIDACIERRLAVIATAAIIAIYGLSIYLNTPIEAYPDVTNIQVTVIAQMPGLAPEEIERQITVPLERALNGTPGMISLRSESLFGLALVTLVFEDDADAFRSRALVTERMGGAGLPEGVTPELAPDATPLGEIYQFRVTSDRHTLAELRSELEWTVSRILKQVPGVGDVINFGGYLKEIHVEVDPARLLAHDLSLGDVVQVLQRSNRNVGGGFMKSGDQEIVIRGVGYLQDAREVQEVVLKSDHGTPVTVGDVARVIVSHAPRLGAVGFGTEMEAIEGFVLLRRGENPSEVLKAVHAKVEELNGHILPEGMRIQVFYDRSDLVSLTLGTVHENLLHGAILIVVMVWLFLRSWRGSLIVGAVIPLALLGAFIGLHLKALPANLISMGAIDFGIIVDGAVVLVEHIIHEARKKKPTTRKAMRALVAQAAVSVARPTLFAMAIILAALIPVFTLERVEGRIFKPLTLTYSFALTGALVFALTVVPALAAVLMRPKDATIEEPKLLHVAGALYGAVVAKLLRMRGIVLAAIALLVLSAAFVGSRLGTEFLPELNEGDLHIFVEMPPSISLRTAEELLLETRKRILAFPEVLGVLSEDGRPEDGTDDELPNMSETFIRLKPIEAWRPGWDKERLVDAMREALSDVPGVRFNFSQPIQDNVEEAVSGVRGKVVLKVFGHDLEAMHAGLEHAKEALKSVSGVVDLDLYRDATAPQLQIKLDRKQLARSGIDVSAAEDVIETALEGKAVTEIWEKERPVPIRVRLPLSERLDIARLSDILVPGPNGTRLPLRELAQIGLARGRTSIMREGNSRYLALKFNIEGRDMGSVVHEAIGVVGEKVKLPEGHYFVWTGEFENQERAMSRLATIIPISLLVVFALLYLSLGNVRSVLAVVLAAPFAMTGGVFALALSGIVLSVSAVVGFIALLGQVALASLLLVGAIDEARREGVGLTEAIVRGARTRMRAIMLALSLGLLGLLPMAVSRGVGSEIQRPFALVIVGGIVTVLAVTLFALPVVYSLIAPRVLRVPGEEDDDA